MTENNDKPNDEKELKLSFPGNFYSKVNPEDIWGDDKLGREASAILLTKLLSKAQTPFTLVVNSPWGTGKTFFIERWHSEIAKKHCSFYFNAWEAELSPLPTLAFLNELQEAIKLDPELFSKVDELWDELFVKVLILTIAIPTLLKMAATTAFEMAQGSTILQGILSIGGAKIKEKYDSALQEKTPTVKEVKKAFQNLANKIQKESSKDKPIYIFIDELDRCKPNFTVKFLEEIKHLFSVQGVVFVLALDLRQLNTSIKHIYGEEVECEGYLRRFINQFYNLPQLSRKEYSEHLFKDIDPKKYPSVIDREKIENFAISFWRISESFDAPLREMESIFSRFIALISYAKEDNVFPVSALYLMFTRVFAPDHWYKSAIKSGSPEHIYPVTLIKAKILTHLPFSNQPDFLYEIHLACRGHRLQELDSLNRASLPKNFQLTSSLFEATLISQRLQDYYSDLKFQRELVEFNATTFGI